MLENVDRILGRMQAIEQKLNGPPTGIGGEDFQKYLQSTESPAKAAAVSRPDLAAQKLNSFGIGRLNPDAPTYGFAQGKDINLKVLSQNNAVSCGQTSVAMTINALTGKSLNDSDINGKYGFELLNALNGECGPAGYTFKDGGEIGPSKWELIDHKVNQEKIPVVVALNGPEFSPSGHGHIVTIVKTEGDKVTFADPARGILRTTTKSAMNTAPQHPDGNFIFYGTRNEDMASPYAGSAGPTGGGI